MGNSRLAVHDQFRRLTLYSGVGLSLLIFICIAVYGTAAESSLDDSDLDSVPDTVDIDDDNDGIPDRYEITLHGSDQDHDNDGTPDRLDLDSDNDGILDVEESGLLRIDAALKLRFEGGRIRATMGLNGFADVLETAPDSGQLAYTIVNSDEVTGDVLPDYLDLDSDNDGLLDLMEAGLPLSLDGNKDGRIDAEPGEVGSDGILDIVQLENDANCCDYSQNGREDITPRNTDGGDFPDYQDHDSDNDGVVDLLEAGGRDLDGDGFIDGFVDDPQNPDGIDDAFLIVPLSPGDSDGNGVDDYIDVEVQFLGESIQSEPEPDNVPDQTPSPDPGPEIPDGTPDESPGVTPDEAPDASPDEDQVPPVNEQPDVTAGDPDGNPDGSPDNNPDNNPDIDPELAPAVANDDANPSATIMDDPIETGLRGNGGCSVANKSQSMDLSLLLLVLFSVGYLLRRQRRLCLSRNSREL